MLDSVYHMTLKLNKIAFGRENVKILPYFTQRYNSPRARNRFNQVAEAKKFEGVLNCVLM